jgi:AraC-like DNA-binding protein
MGPLTVEGRLRLFGPPDEGFDGGVDRAFDGAAPAGFALVWWLLDGEAQQAEYERLRDRPPGIPLIVLLPPAQHIGRTLPLLREVRTLEPRTVLPSAYLGTPDRLREVLAAPPRLLAETVTRYLRRRGIVRTDDLAGEVQRIFELAPEVASITRLARRMYTSRRTLGRHFAAAGVPVPSHWLQFARLLHVGIRLQNDKSAIFRIATRAGYPDGFTLSNQMKRMIGFRPSEVRERLGWEWIIEAWLQREAAAGSLPLPP